MGKIKLHIWIPYDTEWVEIYDEDDTEYLSPPLYTEEDLTAEMAYLEKENKYDMEGLRKELKKKEKLIKEQFEYDIYGHKK